MEPKEGGDKLEQADGQAEVEWRDQQLEAEPGDPFGRLETRRPEARKRRKYPFLGPVFCPAVKAHDSGEYDKNC